MQMLMFRGDWQAALPKLTELGNGLALISSLDAVLGAHGDAVSMQLAPMLGVSVTSAGHLQRMVCTDVLLSHSLCPNVHADMSRTHMGEMMTGQTSNPRDAACDGHHKPSASCN